MIEKLLARRKELIEHASGLRREDMLALASVDALIAMECPDLVDRLAAVTRERDEARREVARLERLMKPNGA